MPYSLHNLSSVRFPVLFRLLLFRSRWIDRCLYQSSLFEKLAKSLLIHWLAQEVVHARPLGLLLVLLPLVGRDTADERLLFPRHVLVHELLDAHARFDSTTLWHAIVEQY